MTIPAPPIDAFLDTDFIAFEGDRECSIRIGEHSPRFDELLSRHGVSSGLFITGWNPFSQPQSHEVNAAANARMLSHFAGMGIPTLHHIGRSSDGAWEEEGFFVLGLSEADGLAIAASFDQHAIVCVASGGVAELKLALAPE